ncbi:amidohydrolase family protein [Pseudidiomarina insulisalsae]|uniref:Amidohydrolase n=1 Tax=Pseudidiomarina insulisalsae TaxID=575789 RepID=A0A432YQ28_9GAMM|nr:amidohydrolase family protein [Pseudidiomarina insulisalsae]RUO63074.1 amidohydrolase [Pseudidiomarina insulisalsae]
MSLLRLFSTFFCVAFLGAGAQALPAIDVETVVRNVNVITWDGQRARVQPQQSIAIRDGNIVAVGDNVAGSEAAKVIDGNGGYVMAGFTEMHGHVPAAVSFGGMPERYADDMLYLYIANGVTTVRGMLGYTDQLQLKRDIAAGTRMGPTLVLAGPSFNDRTVTSPEQAAERVREHVAEGWDLLKIHPGLQLDEYRAVAAAAREAGIDFAGHVPLEVGIDVAMAEGQRTIDHLDGYLRYVGAIDRPVTGAELSQLVSMTVESNTTVVATQALWATLIGAGDARQLAAYPEILLVPQPVRDGWLEYYPRQGSSYFNADTAAIQQENRQRLLKALYEGGATIIFGTDAPQLFSVPGFSIHHEIRSMQDAGIPLEAIYYTATAAASDYFAESHDLKIGHVAPGYQADFILLKDNPLESAAALEQPRGVMVRGQWLDRATIDARLEEIKAAYAAPPHTQP